MNENDYGPIEIALLARLLAQGRKPPTEADVIKSLRPLLRGPAAAHSDDALRAGLDRLARDGLRIQGAMALTPTGKQQAAELLGLRGKAVPTQWRAMKTLLVELALGRQRRGARERALTAGAIRATAMAKKLGIDGTPTKPSDVLDAWTARELGMPGQRLTVANVRAHVLSRALGIAALRDPKRIGAVATAHVLGVPRTDASTVRDAVLGDWLSTPRSAPKARGSGRSERREERDLRAFAEAVKDAAASATDGRFGRHKVFIGPIWNRVREAKRFGAMNEGDFKAKLVDAHRAGLLRLSRADLTPAMAPELVASSEVSYLNAVFHFIDLEGSLS